MTKNFRDQTFAFYTSLLFFYSMAKKGCQILTKFKFPTHTYETLEHVVLSQPSNRKLKKEPFSFSRSCIFKSQRQSSGGSPQSLNSNSILKSIQYFPHAFFPQHLLFQITTPGNSLVPPRWLLHNEMHLVRDPPFPIQFTTSAISPSRWHKETQFLSRNI